VSTHLRLLQPKSPAPLRTYARETIDTFKTDLRQSVLVWRMAGLIHEAVRDRDGLPDSDLAHAPQYEQHFALKLAQALYQATTAIDAGEPPTPEELQQHERRKAAERSRAYARLKAADWGHQVDLFRPGEPGYELARCQRCGAGVSLHLATGQLFGDGTLTQPCLGGIGA
jgi:hypothetical protein